jgi:hypothetical protein
MKKQGRDSLDWNRLLGFEQIADRRGRARIGSKIGDLKEVPRMTPSVG